MKKHQQHGFTMIELLVVLVILGLLAGLVGQNLLGNVDSAKVKTTGVQIKKLKLALQTYRLDVGNYPKSLDGLRSKPSEAANYWAGPYLEEQLPLDGWNNPYQYRIDGQAENGFVLYSFGADGKDGGEELNADLGYVPNK